VLLSYERFGAIALPIYDPSEPVGASGTRASYLDLPAGGAYRGYGVEQAPQGARVLRRTGTMLGASLVEVDVAFAALCAARGTVQPLYARRPDGSVVWTMAELSSVDALREPRALFRGCPEVALDVDTEFVLYDPPWRGSAHGDGWTFDAGYHFDAGLVFDEQTGDVFNLSASSMTIFSLVNAGNATILDPIFEVRASTVGISQVSIRTIGPDGSDQARLLYTGAIFPGHTLRIDAGRQAVETNDTGAYVGDYAHFTLDAGHLIPGWLQLDPGTTVVEVTITSTTDAILTAIYSDGWA